MANFEKKLPWERNEPSKERPVPPDPRPAEKKTRRMFSSGSGGVCVISEKKYPPDSVITSDMPVDEN